MACPQCGKESPSKWTLCDDCMLKKQQSITKEGYRIKSEVRKKNCYHCGAKLYFNRIKYEPIYYKFCIKCGTDNYPHTPNKIHGWAYKWMYELLLIIFPLLLLMLMLFPIAAKGFQKNDLAISMLLTLIIIGIPLFAYTTVRLFTINCPNCLELVSTDNKYCNNCGTKIENNYASDSKLKEERPTSITIICIFIVIASMFYTIKEYATLMWYFKFPILIYVLITFGLWKMKKLYADIFILANIILIILISIMLLFYSLYMFNLDPLLAGFAFRISIVSTVIFATPIYFVLKHRPKMTDYPEWFT
jgi:uncharacterized protein (DUF983 family)